jgi:pimeloyl-ACP methyl ester carboxylesterase
MADAHRPFHEKDVTLPGGLKVHYYEWPGPPPNLVLLHPSSGYGRMWEWTADALGSQCHVYALDQRGHGDSGRPDGDYAAEEYAHDLHMFFQAAGIPRAIVAGQSLGGRVGQVFAALASLRTLRPRDHEAWLRHRLEHNTVASGSGVAVKYDSVRVAIGLAHMADDLRKYAARARCPVAIVRGTRSSELTADEAREIAACWKNAVVVEVEGDYALQMENPAGLAKALIDFAGSAGAA